MDASTSWFILLFAVVLGVWIFNLIKHRGVKGAMFGAELRGTVGEMTLNANPLAKSTVKVHRLQPSDPSAGPHVGVELGFSSVLGAWEMRPVPLTRSQAQELAHLIAKAAE
jgi:hypothetical protein